MNLEASNKCANILKGDEDGHIQSSLTIKSYIIMAQWIELNIRGIPKCQILSAYGMLPHTLPLHCPSMAEHGAEGPFEPCYSWTKCIFHQEYRWAHYLSYATLFCTDTSQVQGHWNYSWPLQRSLEISSICKLRSQIWHPLQHSHPCWPWRFMV